MTTFGLCKVLTYSSENDIPGGWYLHQKRCGFPDVFIHLQTYTILGRKLCKSKLIDRHHAVLKQKEVNGKQFVELQDNSSIYGTFLNGIKLKDDEVKLIKDGDVISLGYPGIIESSFVVKYCHRFDDIPKQRKEPTIVYVSEKCELEETTEAESLETVESVNSIPIKKSKNAFAGKSRKSRGSSRDPSSDFTNSGSEWLNSECSNGSSYKQSESCANSNTDVESDVSSESSISIQNRESDIDMGAISSDIYSSESSKIFEIPGEDVGSNVNVEKGLTSSENASNGNDSCSDLHSDTSVVISSSNSSCKQNSNSDQEDSVILLSDNSIASIHKLNNSAYSSTKTKKRKRFQRIVYPASASSDSDFTADDSYVSISNITIGTPKPNNTNIDRSTSPLSPFFKSYQEVGQHTANTSESDLTAENLSTLGLEQTNNNLNNTTKSNDTKLDRSCSSISPCLIPEIASHTCTQKVNCDNINWENKSLDSSYSQNLSPPRSPSPSLLDNLVIYKKTNQEHLSKDSSLLHLEVKSCLNILQDHSSVLKLPNIVVTPDTDSKHFPCVETNNTGVPSTSLSKNRRSSSPEVVVWSDTGNTSPQPTRKINAEPIKSLFSPVIVSPTSLFSQKQGENCIKNTSRHLSKLSRKHLKLDSNNEEQFEQCEKLIQMRDMKIDDCTLRIQPQTSDGILSTQYLPGMNQDANSVLKRKTLTSDVLDKPGTEKKSARVPASYETHFKVSTKQYNPTGIIKSFPYSKNLLTQSTSMDLVSKGTTSNYQALKLISKTNLLEVNKQTPPSMSESNWAIHYEIKSIASTAAMPANPQMNFTVTQSKATTSALPNVPSNTCTDAIPCKDTIEFNGNDVTMTQRESKSSSNICSKNFQNLLSTRKGSNKNSKNVPSNTSTDVIPCKGTLQCYENNVNKTQYESEFISKLLPKILDREKTTNNSINIPSNICADAILCEDTIQFNKNDMNTTQCKSESYSKIFLKILESRLDTREVMIKKPTVMPHTEKEMHSGPECVPSTSASGSTAQPKLNHRSTLVELITIPDTLDETRESGLGHTTNVPIVKPSKSKTKKAQAKLTSRQRQVLKVLGGKDISKFSASYRKRYNIPVRRKRKNSKHLTDEKEKKCVNQSDLPNNKQNTE